MALLAFVVGGVGLHRTTKTKGKVKLENYNNMVATQSTLRSFCGGPL